MSANIPHFRTHVQKAKSAAESGMQLAAANQTTGQSSRASSSSRNADPDADRGNTAQASTSKKSQKQARQPTNLQVVHPTSTVPLLAKPGKRRKLYDDEHDYSGDSEGRLSGAASLRNLSSVQTSSDLEGPSHGSTHPSSSANRIDVVSRDANATASSSSTNTKSNAEQCEAPTNSGNDLLSVNDTSPASKDPSRLPSSKEIARKRKKSAAPAGSDAALAIVDATSEEDVDTISKSTSVGSSRGCSNAVSPKKQKKDKSKARAATHEPTTQISPNIAIVNEPIAYPSTEASSSSSKFQLQATAKKQGKGKGRAVSEKVQDVEDINITLVGTSTPRLADVDKDVSPSTSTKCKTSKSQQDKPTLPIRAEAHQDAEDPDATLVNSPSSSSAASSASHEVTWRRQTVGETKEEKRLRQTAKLERRAARKATEEEKEARKLGNPSEEDKRLRRIAKLERKALRRAAKEEESKKLGNSTTEDTQVSQDAVSPSSSASPQSTKKAKSRKRSRTGDIEAQVQDVAESKKKRKKETSVHINTASDASTSTSDISTTVNVTSSFPTEPPAGSSSQAIQPQHGLAPTAAQSSNEPEPQVWNSRKGYYWNSYRSEARPVMRRSYHNSQPTNQSSPKAVTKAAKAAAAESKMSLMNMWETLPGFQDRYTRELVRQTLVASK